MAIEHVGTDADITKNKIVYWFMVGGSKSGSLFGLKIQDTDVSVINENKDEVKGVSGPFINDLMNARDKALEAES